MTLQLTKYKSVQTDIDLSDYEPDFLSPKSQDLYKQWQMDKKDELVVDGYFRESNFTTKHLPNEITRTIAAFYTKNASEAYLKKTILEYRNEILAYKTRQRGKKNHALPPMSERIPFVVVLSLAFIFGVDISALIIVNRNDCDLILNTKMSNFLFTGSVAHIVAVTLLCLHSLAIYHWLPIYISTERMYIGPTPHSVNVYRRKNRRCRRCIYYISMIYIWCITFFFILYSIYGVILYSQTHEHHQCSDVLISWIILKLILYVIVAPFAVKVCVGKWFDVNDTSLTRLIYDLFLCQCFLMAIVGLFFSTDIAGIIIAGNNDCDLTVRNYCNNNYCTKYTDFGVNTYLLCGCIVHLAVPFTMLLLTYCRYHKCDGDPIIEPLLLLCLMLFSISWSVIGCLLYSEMEQTNVSNKQCADVTISWAVFRFIEPCLLWCAVQRWIGFTA